MRSLRIPPTPDRAKTWMLEGFDYFKSGQRELPYYLKGIKKQLYSAWMREGKHASKTAAAKTKRKSDTALDQPPVKKTKGSTLAEAEETAAVSIPPTPPTKPLGNLKGKSAIETFFPCCDDESQRGHDEFCSIVLSPGDGNTIRGYFNMGRRMDYRALMLFDEHPTQASSRRVRFKWRGKTLSDGLEEFRGDENVGWMKFLGDGKIEVWFDKFGIRLVAQKGRGIGERNKHSVSAFWEDWHELDAEGLDLLDFDRMAPPNW